MVELLLLGLSNPPTNAIEVPLTTKDVSLLLPLTNARGSSLPLVVHVLIVLIEVVKATPHSIEEFCDETSLENALNSASYNVELEIKCIAFSPSSTHLLREVVEYLSSLLPSYEKDTFIRTNAIVPFANPLQIFET